MSEDLQENNRATEDGSSQVSRGSVALCLGYLCHFIEGEVINSSISGLHRSLQVASGHMCLPIFMTFPSPVEHKKSRIFIVLV